MYKIILILVFVSSYLYAVDQRFRFRAAEERLFLHERLNYNHSFDSDFIWYENRLSNNALRLTYGSVGTLDLMENMELLINHQISDRLIFRLDYYDYKGRIFGQEIEDKTLNLLYNLSNNFKIGVLANPKVRKEYMDLGFTLNIFPRNDLDYFKIDLIAEDLLYNPRNREEGEQYKQPYKIKWNFFKDFNKLKFYTEGRVGTGFRRRYNDLNASDGKLNHSGNTNSFKFSTRYKINDKNLMYLQNFCYFYRENEKNIYNSNSFEYKHKIIENSIEYQYFINENLRIISGMKHIFLDVELQHFNAYNITRFDLMPELRLKYLLNNFEYSLSYFSTLFYLDGENRNHNFKKQKAIYEDKVEIAADILLSDKSRFKISLSHVASVNGFGGGNIQYYLYF